jgi:hypothetical protein
MPQAHVGPNDYTGSTSDGDDLEPSTTNRYTIDPDEAGIGADDIDDTKTAFDDLPNDNYSTAHDDENTNDTTTKTWRPNVGAALRNTKDVVVTNVTDNGGARRFAMLGTAVVSFTGALIVLRRLVRRKQNT